MFMEKFINNYTSPEIEIIEVSVEKGFANSPEDDSEDTGGGTTGGGWG